MLTHTLNRFLDGLLLKLSGGDAIRADELRTRVVGGLLTLIMVTYIPLAAAVVMLTMNRPAPIDLAAADDRQTAIKAWAVRYVNCYLKDPSSTSCLRQFFDGEIETTALPPGGRALGASSALPGVYVDGFATWSVVVDAEIPKAANSQSMTYVPLQVDLSIDPQNLFRAFTLPHARTDRPAGHPVTLATQIQVSEDRPAFKTANGFLSALLIGQGDLEPYVAAGTRLQAANPPRFATMRIERMQTNSDLANAQVVPPKADGVEVTVRVMMQTPSGVPMPMDFPLVMSVVAGRWLVDRINDAPSVVPSPESESDSLTPSSPTTSANPTAPGNYATPQGS